MDQVRIWVTRALAPLAFLVAVAVLVVVVQRALDDEGASAPIQATEPSESVPITVVTGQDEVPPEEQEFYRIRAGDTLEAIAARFDTTVENLEALNPEIDALALEPGTRIRVA